MLRSLCLLALVALALPIAACSSSEPEDTETEPPPSFQIASIVVPFGDGTQGLQFAARPSADVSLVRVDITNPVGNSIVFSPQTAIVLSGQAVQLQNANEAYFRVSGNWTFRFVGSRAAGSQATFDVTTSLPVSAVMEEFPELIEAFD